jgi:hypothetical protein
VVSLGGVFGGANVKHPCRAVAVYKFILLNTFTGECAVLVKRGEDDPAVQHGIIADPAFDVPENDYTQLLHTQEAFTCYAREEEVGFIGGSGRTITRLIIHSLAAEAVH